MTRIPFPQAATPRLSVAARRVRGLRHARLLRWLGHPSAYTIGVLVVTALSVATSLLAPWFLGPAAFGTYALLSSLFQYATKADLGLSQLADRKLAVERGSVTEGAANILRSRTIIGTFVLAVIVPLSMFAVWMTQTLPAVETGLAVASGAAFMIANGPVTVFRATSKVWEFTTTALALNAGLTAPRLLGLLFGGVMGCFVALTFWYAALAGLLSRSASVAAAHRIPVLSMLRMALPLFAFNACWEIYLSANRWISAGLSSADEFGQFAFGANLAVTGIGALATIAQVRYPRILTQIGRRGPRACSNLVEREAHLLCLVLSGGVAFAIIVVGPLIVLLFPRFEMAIPITRALAVSCIPLCVVASILPITIAVSHRPWGDAARIFLPAFVILLGTMIGADHVGHLVGQAWACTFAGLALILGLVASLCRLAVLGVFAAFRIVCVQVAVVTGLALLALSMVPARAESVPPKNWKLAFAEEFESLRLGDGNSGGIWDPQYPWGARTIPDNKELQYYVDPRRGRDDPALAGLAPFVRAEKGIVIIARPIPAPLRQLAGNLSYGSGLLTTFPSFSFTYGYAEMRAKVPEGKGLWPAFWLLPIDKSWPPEIDVMEVLGQSTKEYHATVHTRESGKHTEVSHRLDTPDLADDFHVYAVKWTADNVTWYFDGREVASTPTPADMHKPMYLLVNLAVGGWAQTPDSATIFPAKFHIDRIRVFVPPPPDAGP